MKRYFLGIDYADQPGNYRECLLVEDVDRNLLTAYLDQTVAYSKCTAIGIDCPLGYPVAFRSLLSRLSTTEQCLDRYKSRESETRIRSRIQNFLIVADAKAGAPLFFLPTGHIRATLGLEIAPGGMRKALDLIRERVGPARRRLGAALLRARLGQGPIVEAHPRPFLYSALERIRLANRASLPRPLLVAARDYTDKGKKAQRRRQENRVRLIQALKSRKSWMGEAKRSLQVDSEVFARDDHNFDALLCALTAFMHSNQETWGWRQAAIPRAIAAVEGHMLTLTTPAGDKGASR